MAKNFVSNKDETVTMFKNPFLEKLSRVHWSVPLFLYVPVVFYFLYKAIFVSQMQATYVVALFVAGFIMWTFAEYALHRFVFHTHLPGKLGARMSFIMHGVHHDYPKDSKRLVMVPTISIPLALIFYALFYVLFGGVYLAPVFSGFVTGYLVYDMTHYAIHHYNTKSPYFLKLRQTHTLHHYSNEHDFYGVTSKMWDHVFGTLPEKEENSNEAKA